MFVFEFKFVLVFEFVFVFEFEFVPKVSINKRKKINVVTRAKKRCFFLLFQNQRQNDTHLSYCAHRHKLIETTTLC